MKILNGSELAGYIKERQVRDVRRVRQSLHITPKLAIIVTVEHPAIEVYIRMKRRYGADIGIDVDVYRIEQKDARATIRRLNDDASVHGIIVQLPLDDPAKTEAIVNLVDPNKDVDALGRHAQLEPATPLAILWLLAGYNIDLNGKKIVLVGHGKLVGAPLERMLLASGNDVEVVDKQTTDMEGRVRAADVVVTATGVPGLIAPTMLKQGAVVVDAGVAGEEGKTVGDLAPDVYEREDLIITPQKGGVGPLTICALFENTIRAASSKSVSTSA